MTPRRGRIGPLSVIEWPAPPDAPVIVLFHGYGADGADLAPLAAELALPSQARWIFPDAPLGLEGGGKAWFHLDLASLDRAQREGKSVDWSASEPSLMDQARQEAGDFFQALGAPWERLILGGFSQGAILAADLSLRAPENPRGLAILSGNLVSSEAWRRLAPRRKGLPFFQSHGLADPILGFSGALKLESLLREGGLQGSLLKFEGGHAIPLEVLHGLRAFLSSIL